MGEGEVRRNRGSDIDIDTLSSVKQRASGKCLAQGAKPGGHDDLQGWDGEQGS